MKVALTKGQFAIIDDEDLDRVSQHKWYFSSHGYAATNVGGKTHHRCLYLHHYVLGVTSNKQRYIDHINRDKLDNRKSNLRSVTPRESRLNIKTKGKKVPFRGVNLYTATKRKAKYMVSINRTFIGYFKDPIHAAMAYDIWAKDLYGDMAYLNFPPIKSVGR